MQDQQFPGTSSGESSIWIWIILAALLVAGALTAIGALSLITATQQPQLPTGSQSSPTAR